MMKNQLILVTTLLLSFTLPGSSIAKDNDNKANKGKSEHTAISQSNKQSAEDSLKGLDQAQDRMSEQGKEHMKNKMSKGKK
jgi:hypothetical protein